MIIVESKNFGIEVKKRLLDIGMKQTELAEKIGVSESYISEVLSGKRDAIDTRKKILSIINGEMKEESEPENGGSECGERREESK